jgi:hypothetical protein
MGDNSDAETGEKANAEKKKEEVKTEAASFYLLQNRLHRFSFLLSNRISSPAEASRGWMSIRLN